MPKLYEILAVEKTKQTAVNKLLEESQAKFGKDHFFSGHYKTLSMIKDSPEKSAIEESFKDVKILPTTVEETLGYLLDFWVQSEDVLFAKNKTNQVATADVIFNDAVIALGIPVDELMGLESRLEVLRKLFDKMPTLDAGKEWKPANDGRPGSYVAAIPEVSVKTEKVTTPVVLYEATKEHPAQVKEVTKDETVGSFTRIVYSGAATSRQKADSLATLDELLVAVKQARMRANSVEIVNDRIGNIFAELILDCFK